MEAAAVERAFEPFFRGTSEGTGHGLGLAIVGSYLRALGGSVQLRSELGVGTWVLLRLPRIPPGAEAALHAVPQAAGRPARHREVMPVEVYPQHGPWGFCRGLNAAAAGKQRRHSFGDTLVYSPSDDQVPASAGDPRASLGAGRQGSADE